MKNRALISKCLSLLLTLLLLLSLTAVPALGQEQPEWKYAASFRYLESYNGPGGDVVIPDTVDGPPSPGGFAPPFIPR